MDQKREKAVEAAHLLLSEFGSISLTTLDGECSSYAWRDGPGFWAAAPRSTKDPAAVAKWFEKSRDAAEAIIP